MNALQLKYSKFLIIFFVLTASVSLSSCLLEEEEDVNNPETTEDIIGTWKGKFNKRYCFFDFKEDMTVTIYSESESFDWIIGFPWEYKWKSIDDKIILFDAVKGGNETVTGHLKNDNSIIEICIAGSEITILHRIND